MPGIDRNKLASGVIGVNQHAHGHPDNGLIYRMN